MATRISINSSAFLEMAVGAELRAATTAIAKEAEETAKGLAEDFAITREYIDAFVVTSDTVKLTTEFGEHDVAAGTLTNLSPHAAAVEWGNKRDHRPHHVLTRTLDSLNHD